MLTATKSTALLRTTFPKPVVARFMSTSSRHDNDPEVLEKNKQSILRKHAKGSTEVPHWHEELASDAEAFVKSNRDEINSSESEISKLQNATRKALDPKGGGGKY